MIEISPDTNAVNTGSFIKCSSNANPPPKVTIRLSWDASSSLKPEEGGQSAEAQVPSTLAWTKVKKISVECFAGNHLSNITRTKMVFIKRKFNALTSGRERKEALTLKVSKMRSIEGYARLRIKF